MAGLKERQVVVPPVAYDDDYYLWFNQQADLLRTGRLGEIDIANIAEELEDMGKRERRALISAYQLIMSHMLKWQFQPKRRTRSWRGTIVRERINIRKQEADSPSLRSKVQEILAEAYADTVREASAKTGLPLDAFPLACPWTLDQIRDPDFLPE